MKLGFAKNLTKESQKIRAINLFFRFFRTGDRVVDSKLLRASCEKKIYQSLNFIFIFVAESSFV